MSQLVAPRLNFPSLGHSPSGGSIASLGISPVSGRGVGLASGSQTSSMLAPSLNADSTQRLLAELHLGRQGVNGPTPTSAGLGSYRSSGSGLGARSMLESPRGAKSPTIVDLEQLSAGRTLAQSSSVPLFQRPEDSMYHVDLGAQVQTQAYKAQKMASPSMTSTSSEEYELNLTGDRLARAYDTSGNLSSGFRGEAPGMPRIQLDRSSKSGSSVSSSISDSASATRAQVAALQLAKAKASYQQSLHPEGLPPTADFQTLDGASQNINARQLFSVDLQGSYETAAFRQESGTRSSLPSTSTTPMINVDLSADDPFRLQEDLSMRSQQDAVRASSSTSLPLRTLSSTSIARNLSKDGSIVGSSVGLGVSNEAPEHLTQALTAFGAPNEWYHDSIILGRLSALALRYFHAKASRKPWQAWRYFARSERNRKRQFLRNLTKACQRVALRKIVWQLRSTDDRVDDRKRPIGYARKMPLINALSNLPVILLRPTWTRFRQAVFMRRDLHRRLKLLTIINSKMKQMLARTHYYQYLQRLGLAGFWLATEIAKDVNKIHRGLSSDRPIRWRPSSADTAGVTTHHVAQVLRRAWRRWFYGVRLWMASSEYAVRETELWLTGEISTPRSIVTNSVMQVVSPETHKPDPGLSDSFLGYGGAWNLERQSTRNFVRESSRESRSPHVISSPSLYEPYREEENQLLLPFPNVAVDNGKDNNRHSPHGFREDWRYSHRDRHRNQHESPPPQHEIVARNNYEIFRDKIKATARPRRKIEDEADEIPVPPTRTRRSLVFEQTAQVALENELDRSRRQYEEEESRLLESPLPLELGEHPVGLQRHSPQRNEESLANARQDRRRSSTLGEFKQVLAETNSDDDMEFVAHDARRHHEGHSSRGMPPMLYDRQGAYDFTHDPANDYRAMRSRLGPGTTPKQISLRRG